MLLIGEKLNSSIPSALTIFENRDEAAVLLLMQKQEAAGARFLDLNAAICGDREGETLLWLIGLARAKSGCGIMIDTADPAVMAVALQATGDREVILNSTTIDERFAEVVPLAVKSGASLVALPIDNDGMPQTLEEKQKKIDRLIEKLRAAGLPDERIYIDVLAETLAANAEGAKTAIGAIQYIASRYNGIRTTCGLSNISFGLPRRALINAAFLTAAVYAGLSSAIIDPTNPALQDALMAAQVVAGLDDYCMEYITYIREKENAG